MRMRDWMFAAVMVGVALAPVAPAAAAPVLGPEIRVSVSRVDSQGAPRVGVFADGGFVVVWEAAAGGASTGPIVMHARLFGANGQPVSGEFLLARPANLLALDGVAADGNDRFAVVWDAEGKAPHTGLPVEQVDVQMFHRNGTPLTGPQVASGPSAGNRYAGIVGSGPGGDVVVAWTADVGNPDAGPYYFNAVARIFSSRLRPLSGELTLASGSPTDSSGPYPDAIAQAPDGSLAAAVTYVGDGVSAYAVRVSADGAVLPVDDVYPDGTCCIPNTFDSSLAMAADGRFFIAWDLARSSPSSRLPAPPPQGILGRLFAADGTAAGDAVIQVNRRALPQGKLTEPQVAWLPAGGYLTIWLAEGVNNPWGGVFGHLLAADGAPYGGDFPLDVTDAGNQDAPALASGPNGAVAVWISAHTNTIYARQISAPQ